MDPGGGGGLEARRLLEIAEKLLEARDLIGSKRFAERALESDPLLDNVDLTLAIIDVLLASQRRLNNQINSYAILQLSPNDDSLALKRSYRRLVLLLSPDRNRSPLASLALRFVVDAFSVLSDPVKKSLLDSEIQTNGVVEEGAGRPLKTFWTSCHSCCHVFEYDNLYLNRFLRCRTCQQAFHATEMAAKPPLVPGTDMYYCAWGFFPLGFRGGPVFGGGSNLVVPDFGDGWKPFVPISPVWGSQREKPLNAVPVNYAAGNRSDEVLSVGGKKAGRGAPAARNKKAVAKKRVGSYAKKTFLSGGSELRNEGGEAKGYGGTTAGGVGISHFEIDLDATEDVLGNLSNLPYL